MKSLAAEQSADAPLGVLSHFRVEFYDCLYTRAAALRDPHTADLWTWLIIADHTQLRLARPHAEDLRRPWERPAEPRRLTPARVRRGSVTSA